MADRTAAPRCPRCSAALRPGAPWCTQCYSPAGVNAVAPVGAPALPGVLGPAPSGVTEPVRATPVSPGSWPCSACAQPNDLALETCTGCGTPFLDAVRGTRPTLVLPGVGDVLALTPVRRVGLALGVVVAFVVVAAVLALLLA